MKVAVTGASGFIGRAFVARLRESGREVLPLSRSGGLDYEDLASMARALGGAGAVVHLAARAHQGGEDAAFASNVSAARTTAQAARDAGVARFVLVSSIGVNGNATHGTPFTEANAPAP